MRGIGRRLGVAAALCALAGCGSDDCGEAPGFVCRDLVRVVRLTEDACCGDVAVDPVCVDGAWICPEDATRDCRDFWIPDRCASLRDD